MLDIDVKLLIVDDMRKMIGGGDQPKKMEVYMRELKTLTPEAVPSALEKAKQYRLLGEPYETESICMDILEVDPHHREALSTLVLALTDKFAYVGLQPSFDQAMDVVSRLEAAYDKSYYTGLVYERRAKFHFRQGEPEAVATAYAWFAKAMDAYDQAISGGAVDNQDAVLRWNSCVRFIESHQALKSFDAGQG
ncbi:hypothetical protein DSCO28_54060 [Desulfosarcina ovata subsp. sediminis]|uniref:Uncharacterized protein n=2 Tax=Desulfosarcina ovata TaxID=83564 RepID=A0A5K7ZXK1_9BACT|nr:hypothetical protein DSCO28_54060 [Desulfosarcina ovata subsp. sediminis]